MSSINFADVVPTGAEAGNIGRVRGENLLTWRPVTESRRKTIGWREWVSLPDLGIVEIKAKVDTGADNSSLHAFDLERFQRDGIEMVRFEIHPRQRKRKPSVSCVAEVAGERKVRNPGGRSETRPVIRTRLIIAGEEIEALVNLTTRDEMTFRMLLGRRTVRHSFLIDPGRSYIGERPSRKATT